MKKNRPFPDFVWMGELDERKGIFVCNTYRNDKSCPQFISTISETERNKCIALMKDVKFVTIIKKNYTKNMSKILIIKIILKYTSKYS